MSKHIIYGKTRSQKTVSYIRKNENTKGLVKQCDKAIKKACKEGHFSVDVTEVLSKEKSSEIILIIQGYYNRIGYQLSTKEGDGKDIVITW